MPELQRIVVVGASLAGLRVCETLRTEGFDGTITLVGAEQHPPYDRPPLSKKVLQGEWDHERIVLRRPEALAELGLDERFGVAAVALDVHGPWSVAVRLASGDVIDADAAVIATGSRPRMLPGQPERAFVLRSIEDSLALRAELAPGGRQVCVIGAGFIGLEAAAAARMAGNEVTVLELAPAPLARAFGPEIGTAVADVHGDEGVDVRVGVLIEGYVDGGVALAGGEVVPADVLLVGVGAAPVTDWLAGSGLALDDGVVVDSALRAGTPGVYAAGDVARWPNELFDGEQMRVEHWTNAAEQGAHAARTLLADAAGAPADPYAPVPFVWSDQYRNRVQYLGHGRADDAVEIAIGSAAERRFVALYHRNGRLTAVAGLNLPRLVMPFRALLLGRATIGEARALARSHIS